MKRLNQTKPVTFYILSFFDTFRDFFSVVLSLCAAWCLAWLLIGDPVLLHFLQA
jgi:hypothetical protein